MARKRLTIQEKLRNSRLRVIDKEVIIRKRNIKSLKKLINEIKGNKNVADRFRMKLDTEYKLLENIRRFK